jgi:NADPH:quinone reductase-like Zn-dependent oxidoreductase
MYAVQLAALAGADVTALLRVVEKSRDRLRSLGAATVVDAVEGQFETVVDAVGGTTFAVAIEHIAAQGLVINVATDRASEIVSFRAACYDRAPRATIYAFNLLDELPRMDAAGDLARLVTLLAQRKLARPSNSKPAGRTSATRSTRSCSGRSPGKPCCTSTPPGREPPHPRAPAPDRRSGARAPTGA